MSEQISISEYEKIFEQHASNMLEAVFGLESINKAPQESELEQITSKSPEE